MTKRRVALLYDCEGHCFDRITQQIQRHTPEWDCIRMAYPAVTDGCLSSFDCSIQIGYHGHSYIARGNCKKYISSVYDQVYWNDPQRPHGRTKLLLAESAGSLYAANDALHDALVGAGHKIRGTCQDGVDTALFYPGDRQVGAAKKLVVGWAGVPIALKGLDLIRAACEGVAELRVAERSSRGQTPHEAMRDWYQGLEVYVCASAAEGTPNPILEAAACGVPHVSTRVGIVPELHRTAVCGLFAERSIAGLRQSLVELNSDRELLRQLASNSRVAIETGRWGWEHRARWAFEEVENG